MLPLLRERFRFRSLWAAALCGCWLSATTALPAQELLPGRAIVTTVDGSVLLTPAGGNPSAGILHQTLSPEGLRIETGANGFFGLSLSNGLGLLAGPNSRITIERYRQRPFAAAEASRRFEPSRSELSLRLESGSLALAADRLSPVSEVVIDLPQGAVEVRTALAHLSVEESRARMASVEGSLIFVFPVTGKREFIGLGQGIEVSASTLETGQPDARFTKPSFSPEMRHLIDGARHASRRVIYTVSGSEPAIPEPHLVVPTDALRLPSPRPYRYQ